MKGYRGYVGSSAALGKDFRHTWVSRALVWRFTVFSSSEGLSGRVISRFACLAVFKIQANAVSMADVLVNVRSSIEVRVCGLLCSPHYS
jgi:hypothetical protein